jgi:hypothetical protein
MSVLTFNIFHFTLAKKVTVIRIYEINYLKRSDFELSWKTLFINRFKRRSLYKVAMIIINLVC